MSEPERQRGAAPALRWRSGSESLGEPMRLSACLNIHALAVLFAFTVGCGRTPVEVKDAVADKPNAADGKLTTPWNGKGVHPGTVVAYRMIGGEYGGFRKVPGDIFTPMFQAGSEVDEQETKELRFENRHLEKTQPQAVPT